MQLRANIADEINQHHEIAIARADEAIHHASQAGKLLLEVKAALPHGQFLAWVQQHVLVSARQAQRYMAVAEGKPAPIRALGSKGDTLAPSHEGVSEVERAEQWCREAAAADQEARTALRAFEQKLGDEGLTVEEAVAIVRGCEQIEEGIRTRREEASRRIAELERGSKSDTVSHLPELSASSPAEWPAPTWWPLPGHWMSTKTADAAYWVVPALEHPGFFHISKFYTSPEAQEASDGKPAPADWDGESYFEGTRRPVRADVVEAFLQRLGLADLAGAAWECVKREGLERPFGEPEIP